MAEILNKGYLSFITTAKALYISQRIYTKTGSIGVKEGSREFPIHTKTLENVTFQVTNIVAAVGL